MPASILAWPGAVAIGISLGLLGSGGSILTVPVLVYLIGQDEKVAIAGSLFVVGTIALAGRLAQCAGLRATRHGGHLYRRRPRGISDRDHATHFVCRCDAARFLVHATAD